MDAADNTGKPPGPELAAAPAAEAGTAASTPAGGHPLGSDAVAILATDPEPECPAGGSVLLVWLPRLAH